MIHLVGPPGYFTFLYGHKRNTTERVREKKKNKRTNTDLCQHSPCIRRLMLACILRETSTKCTNNADIFSRWLTQSLCSSSGFSSCLSDFCWLSFSGLSTQSRQLPSALRSRLPLCVFLRQPNLSLLSDLPFRPQNYFFIYLFIADFSPHLGSFFCVVSSFTTFRPNSLWPSSGDLPKPARGLLCQKNYQDEGEKSAINK